MNSLGYTAMFMILHVGANEQVLHVFQEVLFVEIYEIRKIVVCISCCGNINSSPPVIVKHG